MDGWCPISHLWEEALILALFRISDCNGWILSPMVWPSDSGLKVGARCVWKNCRLMEFQHLDFMILHSTINSWSLSNKADFNVFISFASSLSPGSRSMSIASTGSACWPSGLHFWRLRIVSCLWSWATSQTHEMSWLIRALQLQLVHRSMRGGVRARAHHRIHDRSPLR